MGFHAFSSLSRVGTGKTSPKRVKCIVEPLRLFLSYSHKDVKAVEELRASLKVMERNGLIEPWYDRELVAGQEWDQELLRRLSEADVIVCQISRHFLASDFCVSQELALAAQRQETGEAVLIGYPLHDCDWREVENLRRFQLIPPDAMSKDHGSWRNQNRYWKTITDGIRASLKMLQESPAFRAKRVRERNTRRRLSERER